MADCVPRDVLIDILIRLPIKTLVRFTCVCKSWYSLLTNPNFITAHLNRPSGDLLLVHTNTEDRHRGNYAVYCDNEAFDELLKLEFPLEPRGNYCRRIIGSCKGLMCVQDPISICSYAIILWNPSIRKAVTLPIARVNFESHGPHVSVFGFGFDPLSNDYKVVRIVYLVWVEIPAAVDIFTLNTGTWRDISHLGLSCRISPGKRQAYLNGAAYWVAIDRTNGFRNLIVSFSMSDEVFREINPPDMIRGTDHWVEHVDVVNFRGSLALFETKSLNRWNYCIWVMKEYGVAESWTKQIVIDLHVRDFKWFVGFRKKGEVLLGSEMGFLEYYDPKEKQCKTLGIYCPAETFFRSSFYMDAYMESLVLLGVKSCEVSHNFHEGSGPKKIN